MPCLKDDELWAAMGENGNVNAFETIEGLRGLNATGSGAVKADWADIRWWANAMLSVAPQLSQSAHAIESSDRSRPGNGRRVHGAAESPRRYTRGRGKQYAIRVRRWLGTAGHVQFLERSCGARNGPWLERHTGTLRFRRKGGNRARCVRKILLPLAAAILLVCLCRRAFGVSLCHSRRSHRRSRAGRLSKKCGAKSPWILVLILS